MFICLYIVFHTLYNTDENLFLGESAGAGKTICAKFGILRLFSNEKRKENLKPKCVYVIYKEEIVRHDWDRRFAAVGKKSCYAYR